jgi:hypothetical protein
METCFDVRKFTWDLRCKCIVLEWRFQLLCVRGEVELRCTHFGVCGGVCELQLGWYVEALGIEPRNSCPVNTRMCNYSVTKP